MPFSTTIVINRLKQKTNREDKKIRKGIGLYDFVCVCVGGGGGAIDMVGIEGKASVVSHHQEAM